MSRTWISRRSAAAAVVMGLLLAVGSVTQTGAQTAGPTMLHPRLGVRTVVAGLTTPTTMAFIGADDLLVLEKNTGVVKRVSSHWK